MGFFGDFAAHAGAGDGGEKCVAALKAGAVSVFPGADDGVEITDQGQRQRHQLRDRPIEQGEERAGTVAGAGRQSLGDAAFDSVAFDSIALCRQLHEAIQHSATRAQQQEPEQYAEPAAQGAAEHRFDHRAAIGHRNVVIEAEAAG